MIDLTRQNIEALFVATVEETDISTCLHKKCDYFYDKAGVGIYPLLVAISQQFDCAEFLDVGTNHGTSAIALASNSRNEVSTYDIVANVINRLPDNAEFRMVDLLDYDCEEFADVVRDVDVILFDIDPHDGEKERKFVKLLYASWWQGILILDDIHLNKGMQDFWEWLTLDTGIKCYDVTDVGHSTGTGVVDFSNGDVFELKL